MDRTTDGSELRATVTNAVREIPTTMDALVLPAAGEYEIQSVPVPEPEPDEVLCRIRAVTICGSDPEIIRGDLAGFWPPAYPFTPGHEWAGEVVAVGDDVYGYEVGDRVAGQAHKGCGFCERCLAGRYNICENYGKPESGHRHYGFTSRGAFAQYNTYSVRSITKLPDNVSFHEGALTDASGVVVHAMELSGITPAGTVAVIGPGPIGLISMRTAKLLGAARVIVIGRGERLRSAERLGADEIIDFEHDDPVDAVRALTGGLGVHEAFECSGARGTFRQAVEMVQRGGRVGLVGVPEGVVMEEIPFGYVVSNEIAVFGSKANPNVSHKILTWVAEERLVLRDLVTHVFALADFPIALETFVKRKDGAMKVVVEPNGPADSGDESRKW